MTTEKLKNTVNKLSAVLLREFEFNGIKISVNYAARAKHGKNWIIAPHCHPWFEFNYVSKGSVYTTIDGREFLVCGGMSYIIPPGIVHSHRNNNTGDDGICIRFSLDSAHADRICKDALSAIAAPHPCAFNSHIDRLNLSGDVCGIQAEFVSWIMHTANTWITPDKSAGINSKNILSHQVILYLEEYHNTKIKVGDIANAVNMSYRSLSRKFMAETGMTISDKITEIRIRRAKYLLLATKMPLYDIAAEVGYENEFYFSKKFKQAEKISPAVYRRNGIKTNKTIDTAYRNGI